MKYYHLGILWSQVFLSSSPTLHLWSEDNIMPTQNVRGEGEGEGSESVGCEILRRRGNKLGIGD